MTNNELYSVCFSEDNVGGYPYIIAGKEYFIEGVDDDGDPYFIDESGDRNYYHMDFDVDSTGFKHCLPHVFRMMIEKRELDKKINNLSEFILPGNPPFDCISEDDKNLLRLQLQAMEVYQEVLDIRLDRSLRSVEQD